MGWFHKKEQQVKKASFDPAVSEPAMRCSICTGERVFGFRAKDGGSFEEVCLIRNDAELERVCGEYGISPQDVVKFY